MSRISSGVGGEIRHDIYSCYTRIAHRAQHNYRSFLRPPQSVISVLESVMAVAGQSSTHNPPKYRNSKLLTRLGSLLA